MTEPRADIITGSLRAPAGVTCPPWLVDRLEWFSDLKFGLFVHWGIYSQWGCIESWPLVEADTWARPDDLPAWVERGKNLDRFRRDYFALQRTFNPTAFDADRWADLAVRAGMKYVAFTTKHHDGFCMFDTATTDFRITHPDCPFHSHPKADITRQVFDAFRGRGLGVTCYFSKSDWHCPWYWSPEAPAHDRHPNYDTAAHPGRWAAFVRFVHQQVRELMTKYGPIDVLWLDGGQVRPPTQDIQMDELVAEARRHQPGLIVADRTVGGEHENFLTPEQQVPDKPLDWYWESCMTMGRSWSYKPADDYKSARQLIHMLVDVVAKGGNLLLNVGADPLGCFDPVAVDRLSAIGDWMAINAQAIHGTRPIAPFAAGNVRYTARGRTVYAIVLDDGSPTHLPTRMTFTHLPPARDTAVHLLGLDAPLRWSADGHQAWQVTLPTIDKPTTMASAWVLRYDVDPPAPTDG